MKVILKTHVENLGSFGDEVKVAPGYARNYLIPNGYALPSTPGNMKQFMAEREAFLKKAQVKKEKAEKLRSELEAVSLSFARKAGEDDKLFGSVTSNDVAAELKSKGFEIEKKDIVLNEPLKALGQFTVSVKLHPEVSAEVKVGITKE